MGSIEMACIKYGVYGNKARLLELIAANGVMSNSKREFAEYLGVSEMTVFRYLKELESKGLISISGYSGAAKTYRYLGEVDEHKELPKTDVERLEREIEKLHDEVVELSLIVKELTEIITSHIKDHNDWEQQAITSGNNKATTSNDDIPRARVNNKLNNKKETDNMKSKEETELKRVRDSHNNSHSQGDEQAMVIFDEIWDGIDWMQKMRFRQTKDVQWKYAKNVLGEILEKVSPETLMNRIRSMVGEKMIFGKTISYWLKDNADILMARESGSMDWRKFESSPDRAPMSSWSLIANAVGC